MSEPIKEQLEQAKPGWSRAYAFVLGFFALEIVLLYLFTIRFS